MSSAPRSDLEQYHQIIAELKAGQYISNVPANNHLPLVSELHELGRVLLAREQQRNLLDRMVQRANAGLTLDEILNFVYEDFRAVIPYERIGVALLDPGAELVLSRWIRSDFAPVLLGEGYAAPIAGSSLEKILHTGEPRILNDLPAYLEARPQSRSTALIVKEGFRSSLTCPLIAEGQPVGFIFFSSTTPGIYAHIHRDIFRQIAGQLSVILERGRLASQLAAQKETLQAQNEELQRRNDLRNRLMGIAAHDLRSPLGYILTTIELLTGDETEKYTAERPYLLSTIAKQARHMVRLVSDLLDFSEIEAGKLQIRPQLVDMPRAVEESLGLYREMAAQKKISLVTERLDRGNVWGDAVRLRQVLENLISNAIKYSPLGSEVKISVHRNLAHWRVVVADQGPGLTTADRERLFQPFARLSAVPTGGEKSTGLGLAITRTYVEAQGGQIGVESEPGKGARFWFTLPVPHEDG